MKRDSRQSLIFDIGMYDGADTAYYLDCGHKVVAVEANPELVESARSRFVSEIRSGRLNLINAAVSPKGESVALRLSGQDLGSSSLFEAHVANKLPIGSVVAPGLTLHQLLERFGVPEYLKVDIEGADRLCVLPLTPETRPKYLSFEVGDDFDELLSHLVSVGFKRFKVINQISFRELANQASLRDRISHRFMRWLGFAEPRLIRRSGRFFVSGHSSGPVPWHSDGLWRSVDSVRAGLNQARQENTLFGWYDIHASAQ